ncbi:MAG: hypothetical protein KHX03_04540 [Clostridium sp.]|nr:hypothetical protein [Clostridium sp.]
MSIKKIIKTILVEEEITMTQLSEKLSAVKNKKITLDSISKKLAKNTIKYYEVEEILDLLGYKIKIEKK